MKPFDDSVWVGKLRSKKVEFKLPSVGFRPKFDPAADATEDDVSGKGRRTHTATDAMSVAPKTSSNRSINKALCTVQ